MPNNINADKDLYKILGPVSSRLITKLNQRKQTVFSSNEAAQLLATDGKHVKKLLYDLVKKGWLQRIEKGKYLLIPLTANPQKPYSENQFLIASKMIEPYYIGFWSMLHYYGFTEQLLNTIFIVSTKKKRSYSLLGVSYEFVKISPKKMFGIVEIDINGIPVKVSDKEKTLIDCLDHPEYCGGIYEIAKGIWNARDDIDYNKLLNYAEKNVNSAVAKRMGYLLEVLKLDSRIDSQVLKNSISKGYSSLDPLLPKKGNYISKWNILVNVHKDELLSFRKA